MNTKTHFPFFSSVASTLAARGARRTYVAILVFLLLITSVARLRSYFMVRKIQAVLHSLAEIRLGQTTEEQLTKMVPYLSKKDWATNGISHRIYYVQISNESDAQILGPTIYGLDWSGHLADWLGYRFISFDLSLLVQDGKVSQVEYGLANHWERPKYPGYTGYIVSARSVHGFWLPRQIGFGVSSVDDESPHYRPRGGENGLYVIYTADAPSNLTERAFLLKLGCFWSLRGCNDAREIAPALWQDAQAIQAATYQQLISGKCPDSIIEGRMRYLPDVTILLLQVTGSRRIEVNEEGGRAEDWFTDYSLREVIRGRSFGSWKNVRSRPTIPSPDDPTRTIANQVWPPTKIGSQVLFFGNLNFYSCKIIPATPSAIEIVRDTPVPQKRPEDEVPMGLQ
jgi:hypothetical protein